MSIVTILLPFLIKLSLCVPYIDFKRMMISDGLILHNGYINSFSNTYKFFLGRNETIGLIKYGDEIIFSIESVDKNNFKLAVEYLGYINSRFLILHLSYEDDKNEEIAETMYFQFHEILVTRIVHLPIYVKNSKIYLSLDINEETINHPFILINKYEQGEVKITEYTVIDEFMGVKFDSKSFPKYKFGYVFDSKSDVVIGYSIFPTFVYKCDKFIIESRENDEQAVVQDEQYNLKFSKIESNLREYWSYKGDSSLLVESDRKKALMVEKRIWTRKRRSHGSKILDIQGVINPRFQGIERTCGSIGSYIYSLFMPEISKKEIENIIDTRYRPFIIYTPIIFENVVAVEAIENDDETFVIINSVVGTNSSSERSKIMYYKGKIVKRYDMVGTDEKTKKMKLFRNMYPVLLNINIDSESTQVYGNDKLNDDRFNFTYIYIKDLKEFDDEEDEPKKKYNFGSLSEIIPYEIGNIPNEKYKRNTRLIKHGIRSSELLLLNPFPTKPISVKSYEVYRLM